jgi:DNA-binding beta-propeller fold protein YncE
MTQRNLRLADGWRLCFFVLLLLLGACAPVPQSQSPGRTQQVVFPPPPDEARFVYERTFYSSSDVLPEDSSSELRRRLTGEARRGEGFTKPYAVAVHKGRIFLSDSVERFIKVLDLPQGRFFRIGDDEPGRLAKPLGIDVDASGNLYVADASAKAIMVYDRDGKFLRKLGGEKWFDRLSSVTVDPRGDRVFAVDIGGVNSEHHRVRVFDSVKGNHLFDIGSRGSGPGEFNLPRDLAVGKDGQMFVVDGGNFRVQVFDRDGKFVRTFGAAGKQVGNFARPKEIATDRSGNVYIVDTAFGNFQIFDAAGEMLMFIGERSERDGPAKYMLPSGIAVDEDGRIYMVDQWFRKIDIFRPAGLKAEDGFLGARGRLAVKAAK